MRKKFLKTLFSAMLITVFCSGLCACDLLNALPKNSSSEPASAAHEHVYEPKGNENGHFSQCACGDTKDEGAHTESAWQPYSARHEKICTFCGYVLESAEHDFSEGVCQTCGYVLSYEDKCASDYGYRFFASVEQGEDKQKLYLDLDEKARAFHGDEALDAAFAESSSSYVLESIDFSAYGLTKEDALSVWSIYRKDHPLYYWMDNRVLYTDTELTLCVYESYALGAARAEINRTIYQGIDRALDAAAKETSAYQLALSFHDSLISEIEYDYDGTGSEEWVYGVYGAFVKKNAVCEGYAKAFQLLLNAAGVENAYVTGTGKDENHAWNLAAMDDGKWYWFDLTWDDQPAFAHGRIYDYFCKANGEFADHAVAESKEGAEYTYALPTVASESYQSDSITLGKSFSADKLTYTLVGYRAVSVTACELGGEPVLPETVVYGDRAYTLVEIGLNAFEKNTALTALTIPSSVKVIREFAFYRCDNLKSITLSAEGWTRSLSGRSEEIPAEELSEPERAAERLKELYRADGFVYGYRWTKK